MVNNRTILLTANYAGKPLEIVRELIPCGFSLVTMKTRTQSELNEIASCADYIIASGNLMIDRSVLEAASKLKMVQRLGVGLDSLDLLSLEKRKIPVYVNKGVNADSVAEHTIMFILSSLRRLTVISENTKHRTWKKQEQGVTTRDLRKQTVGIIGFGNIGKKVAMLLKPFGCKVIYFAPHRIRDEYEKILNSEYRCLEELYAEADIITLHCALDQDTRNMISKESINKMKNGAIIVNTSRGGLICEEDLLEALNNGKLQGAALDVYQEEPTENIDLLNHRNIICTPHIAGNTYDSFWQMMSLAIENIWLFDQGRYSEIEHNLIG